MRRGILAALAALATMFVPAASAAPQQRYVVYELVWTGPRAYPTSFVRVRSTSPVFMYAALEPNDDGGYSLRSAGLSMGSGGGLQERVDLTHGRRFLIAAQRGSTSFYFAAPQWAARETRLAFHIVTRAPGDMTTVAGRTYETFRSATSPGGAYGSLAFAEAPCGSGAGLYSFYREEEKQVVPGVCAGGGGRRFGEAPRSTTWHLDGPVVAPDGTLPYRLIVLDYPRR